MSTYRNGALCTASPRNQGERSLPWAGTSRRRLTAGVFTNRFDDLDNYFATLEGYAVSSVELVSVDPLPATWIQRVSSQTGFN